MLAISEHALTAARGCCDYCLTRFPCDTPPHEMLDLPWFAEAVQKAIDAALAEAAQAKRRRKSRYVAMRCEACGHTAEKYPNARFHYGSDRRICGRFRRVP